MLTQSDYRFFGPFSGYRGSFQTQGMLKVQLSCTWSSERSYERNLQKINYH